jgi:hypothetical protein
LQEASWHHDNPERDFQLATPRKGVRDKSVNVVLVWPFQAGPLLSRTNELIGSKLIELRQAADVYKSDNPASRADAVKRLDAAIADMDGVMDDELPSRQD